MKYQITYDRFAASPREEDNLACFDFSNNRYVCGDKCPRVRECADEIAIAVPVYAYVHGSVALSLRPFSCQWDSGQIGYAYILKNALDGLSEEYKSEEAMIKIIAGELRTYNNYLQGECYVVTVDDFTVSGFIGELSGDDSILPDILANFGDEHAKGLTLAAQSNGEEVECEPEYTIEQQQLALVYEI